MQSIRALLHEIRRTLQDVADGKEHAREVLSILDTMDLSAANQHHWTPVEPVHGAALQRAMAAIPHRLSRLADGLKHALPQLQWRVDGGIYYDLTANIGDGFRNGNMHCELIGPDGSAFHHDDFTLGLFLLTPRVLYRDHSHRAPELYLPLMEPTGWRFADRDWQEVLAGTVIWNVPETSHAIRVYDTPFLSIYSWTRDVRSKCRVVERADWRELEAALGATDRQAQL